MTIIDGMFALILLSFLSARVRCNDKPIKPKCFSPQYLQLGKTGFINCDFEETPYSVLWYTEVDFDTGTPTIRYQHNDIGGPGYESGEFSIQTNGSLIINKVDLKHDSVFTVAYAQSNEDLYDVIKVRTIVLVKPDVPFPSIAQCNRVSYKCYAEVVEPSLQCSVRGIRPNITLSLLIRTVYGDKNIPNHITVIPEGEGYTSSVTIRDVFHYSPVLALLVCKAFGLPGLLERNESTLLVLNNTVDITIVKSEQINIRDNKKMELNCANHDIGFAVWKKSSSSNNMDQELLLYSVIINERFTEIFDDDVSLGENISLLIHSTHVEHEGIYLCIFGDGLRDGVKAYNVTVIVPAYPLIKGCNQEQYCVLDADYEGNLTCTVKRIRPQVQLRWKTFSEVEKTLIAFTNQRMTVIKNGDTFDVTLVSQYHVKEKSPGKITVECEVVSSVQDLLGASMKMDLLFETGLLPTHQTSTSLTWIVPVCVTLILVLLVCGVIFLKWHQQRNTPSSDVGNEDEMAAVFTHDHSKRGTMTEQKKQFIKELQVKYKDLYDAVQPIPFIKDRLYCVDRVFVEGGVEYFDSIPGTKEQWADVGSYQNLFDDPRVKSKRRILEGEPGYGKSTVTLQFAYDWCNCIQTSPLRHVDILILLRLRQLGGVTSIYRAIKRILLPKDSLLTESDIKHILQNSHSTVILLDGFDEYPDQNSTKSDVISIIRMQMFQDFEVVLTTRSSVLPEKYPSSTKRLRLTGFDEKARRYYIRKAVVGDDDEDNIRKIEEYLEDKQILSDLCQVPLLFVIFAHMTHESEKFRELNSVTCLFRYMISCFHGHMRNKMDDENVRKCELVENEHRDLDKLAFEALSGQSQSIIWEKNKMQQLVGQDFYDQYIRIGILVEEESVNITDDPGTPITEHVQYKTEVRFYHKLFCEWYAAHYLSGCIEENPDFDLSINLKQLHPFDVQYLYRFACGLNSKAHKKIITYLKGIKGGNNFVILCFLEQTNEFDNVKDAIISLCYEGVVISGHDSLLLQRSSIQLLEIATKNSIPIEYVELHNCLHSVDISTPAVRTISGLTLTSRIQVKVLVVSLTNRKITENEYIAIVDYSSKCESLRELRIWGSAPPISFKLGPYLSILSSRNVSKDRWQYRIRKRRFRPNELRLCQRREEDRR
ncbi:hypothetical protein HOLleu_04467 [Holothuria leucospilota]|uniref:Immunoglobulin domain-containing protein n=1 Tax=Holothuria leucospilota TaxID=206669 RepID=A0A9Q1HLW1_HOLLE|nr:hypothetical protein HOLleu_04467 [Holothuria leucospilota]